MITKINADKYMKGYNGYDCQRAARVHENAIRLYATLVELVTDAPNSAENAAELIDYIKDGEI